MSVETVVEEVKQEVVKVAEEAKQEVGVVVTEVKKVGSEVVVEAKKLTQELSAEEKLAIREVENAYLKAQMEIQRLSQITQKAQQDFTKNVENLAKKYALDSSRWVFDNVELIWKKR